jgi:hypothetical protein
MKTGCRGKIRDGPTSARTPETEEAVAGVVEEQLSPRNVDDGRNLRASSCLNSFIAETSSYVSEKIDYRRQTKRGRFGNWERSSHGCG